MRNDILKDFYNDFYIGAEIDKDDLRKFFLKYYEDISDASLAWRIYDLKKEKLIISKSSNVYAVIDNKAFIDFFIDNDKNIVRLLKDYNKKVVNLKSRFGNEVNVNISIWNTKILNNYTTHQTYMNYNIIEIDKDRIENLYYHLKEHHVDVFMINDIKGLHHILNNNSVIIAPLPLRSPLENKKSYKSNYVGFPKAEKVLVDVFVYNKSLLPYDLSEIENIYRKMYKKHILKNKTILQYARIRGVKTRNLVENMLERIGKLYND
ncbi:hypothetical protein KHQ89_01935 [Mycoplasmatota bacterium]|nr:hypothetical protein KHQ89_01935 [Mycoplasmatota bacterium]